MARGLRLFERVVHVGEKNLLFFDSWYTGSCTLHKTNPYPSLSLPIHTHVNDVSIVRIGFFLGTTNLHTLIWAGEKSYTNMLFSQVPHLNI